jgi:circadian clock protein KaiB
MAYRKTYILKLYVAGNTPNSMRALKTLRNILETEFRGVYALKVIDVLKNPQLAEEDKILATPTLAKILPPPVRRIIGDLSDRERVLIGLDLLYEELSEETFDLPGQQSVEFAESSESSESVSEGSEPAAGP